MGSETACENNKWSSWKISVYDSAGKTHVVMKQPGIATTVFADVELVSLHPTSSPSLNSGGTSGGHVCGSAKLYKAQILSSSVRGTQLPVCSSCFSFRTLSLGSLSLREFERLESPKKYVPSPAIVAEASVIAVSQEIIIIPETKPPAKTVIHTIRDAFDLSGRSIAPSYGIRNCDPIAGGVHFDNIVFVWRINFASWP